MKAFYVLAALLPAVLADKWNMCACQQASGSATLVDSATGACCTNGGSMKSITYTGSSTSQLRFPGNYCVNYDNNHDGDTFYNCCKSNGAADSACINWA
ncbi:hypothetical protein N7537_004068 [Neofusicoccum parvum]|uniref:Uncharacterized protein n=2 Tax=Neofusicoccum parvum TaxID=310453 RepID=R1GWQ1_BOTPV|nr:hypothetical protein UCRNP2_2726 [Neofusicoccum parvum UCRNP2]GME25906.1 hypothetical protein N7537_004068 [Neofusicoccum parvum]GME35919.1 hypothetical protein N7537_004068 [Neofusicoccum parvum]